MKRTLAGIASLTPLPVMALDVAAISRSIVEASPWGKNADVLPLLLAWFGITLFVAVALKLLYTAFDSWRSERKARDTARQHTEEWILEVGELLGVRPPRDLKPGTRPAAWHQYRHQVKTALVGELQRGRQLAARVADLQRD